VRKHGPPGQQAQLARGQRPYLNRKENFMALLANKKIVIIGDRDGIPGPAIEECIKTAAGAEVLFSSTECFV